MARRERPHPGAQRGQTNTDGPPMSYPLADGPCRYAGHDPDRVSFVAALRIARQTVTHQGAFPPDDHDRERLWQALVRTLLTRLNQGRRLRTAPRVIKREMPK